MTADLVAWSLECLASGKAPERGFKGETFEKGTFRQAMAGQELAGGFKKLGFQVWCIFGNPFGQLLVSCLLGMNAFQFKGYVFMFRFSFGCVMPVFLH